MLSDEMRFAFDFQEDSMNNLEPKGLDTDSVLVALESLRLARPIRPDHPLTCFKSLYDPLLGLVPMREDVRRDMHIFNGLAQVIRQKLNDFRMSYQLPLASESDKRNVALHIWLKDFQQCNTEFEAWSLLYYRYIHLDIGLSVAQISSYLGQPKRTLNRRQQLGLVRLTHFLVKQEFVARLRLTTTMNPPRPIEHPPIVVKETLFSDFSLSLMPGKTQ